MNNKDTRAHALERRMGRQGFCLYLPAIIVIFLVILYPLIYALVMSFTNYRPTNRNTDVVGLANYAKIGLALAQLLNHPRLKFKMLFRGLAITPWLIPTVSVAIIFKWMFNDLYGILNFLLVDIGILDKPYAWMSGGATAMFILILANIWRGTPLMLTMFLAGLQGIPKEMYEAPMIDGASSCNYGIWCIEVYLDIQFL